MAAKVTDTTRRCSTCEQWLPHDAFSKNNAYSHGLSNTCRQCQSERMKARRAAGKPERTPEKGREKKLRDLYGISTADYDALLTAQGGGCAICGSKTPKSSRSKHLFVDHDHDTGDVRGLLCHQCNAAIGLFQDDPARIAAAVAYLLKEKP